MSYRSGLVGRWSFDSIRVIFPLLLLATTDVLQDNITIIRVFYYKSSIIIYYYHYCIFVRRLLLTDTDSVGYNLKVSHSRHVFNCSLTRNDPSTICRKLMNEIHTKFHTFGSNCYLVMAVKSEQIFGWQSCCFKCYKLLDKNCVVFQNLLPYIVSVCYSVLSAASIGPPQKFALVSCCYYRLYKIKCARL
jgi:hypothetical protein